MINVVSSSSSCYNDCVALPLFPAPSNHCTLYTVHEPHFCTSIEFLAHPILHLDEYIPLPYFFLPAPYPTSSPPTCPASSPCPASFLHRFLIHQSYLQMKVSGSSPVILLVTWIHSLVWDFVLPHPCSLCSIGLWWQSVGLALLCRSIHTSKPNGTEHSS